MRLCGCFYCSSLSSNPIYSTPSIKTSVNRHQYIYSLHLCCYCLHPPLCCKIIQTNTSESEKWKWSDIQPSMVTHTQNLCSAINPSKVHTHSSEHTHCEHTPRAVGSHLCCGTRGAVGGSEPCSRAPQSWYWGWRESAVHSLPPPTIPAGPRLKLATFGWRVQLSNH